MRFLRVRLGSPVGTLSALADFYGERLDLELLDTRDDCVTIGIGESRLEFAAAADEPFYHFALLAPGDRFPALLDWAAARVGLLPDPETGAVVFEGGWDAQACYFHDPAGNIVELISHHGIEEAQAEGRFSGQELGGISELGLVGDTSGLADVLHRELGLDLWDGVVGSDRHLAFVGARARTLILAPVGRPWVPTGRAAQAHVVEAVLSGGDHAEVRLPSSQAVVRIEGRHN